MDKENVYSEIFRQNNNNQNDRKNIFYHLNQERYQTSNNQQQQQIPTGNFSQEQITILSTLPFWISDYTEHSHIYDETNSKCCFNHYVGIPWKYADRLPLFDYEIHETFQGQPGIYHAYENNDCVWILKATGLGITEFSLRYMCWKALTGDAAHYQNSKMIIVTGPNLKLAIDLINRIRFMFLDKLGVFFSGDKTTITLPLNNVTIQAFPSNHTEAMRGLAKVSIILIDEGDYFHPSEQTEVRAAAERYIGKSKTKIFVVSTPGAPGGLMETIQNEQDSIYRKIKLHWEVGKNKIYRQDEIDRARQSPSFEREYGLQYAYGLGDLFLESTIQKCLNIKYDPTAIVKMAPKCISIDPAWGGSSKFAYVVTQFVDGKIQILVADEFERPDPKQMEMYALDLIQQYRLFFDTRQIGQVIVDGANVAFIKFLKRMYDDHPNYENDKPEDLVYRRIRPINFGVMHKQMLTNMQQLIAKEFVAIDSKFDSLLNQMRIAKVDANYSLIKKPLSLDLIDALRMNLLGYSII